MDAGEEADRFVRQETAFHLGGLPTEQPHPLTAGFAEVAEADTQAGVRMLQAVDRDIVPVARRVLASPEFERLRVSLRRALEGGGRVFFTGCGATGRLSILLEACWRRFWQRLRFSGAPLSAGAAQLEDRVFSIMAGGDFALIRSVEGFEDFTDFGRHQCRELGVGASDVVVAITEGGETSFVIGTAWHGVEVGADVFFVFNNPADTLAALVERSREVIEDPRITKLDLASGPMAVAGSTRMQATTAELLVVGAALELALADLLGSLGISIESRVCSDPAEYARSYEELLDDLGADAAVDAMTAATDLETGVYSRQGLVTYLADEYLLDLLTDTTERSPTFLLPPFRRRGDTVSPHSWAFAKNPTLATEDAWRALLRREIRGLDWDASTYRAMGAPESLVANPPALGRDEILKFGIGQEEDGDREARPGSAVVAVVGGSDARSQILESRAFDDELERLSTELQASAVLVVGPQDVDDSLGVKSFHVPCRLQESTLDLWAHLGVKLTLNTISTATMAHLGRLDSNWMVAVQPSNKKLIDRATRLIAELAKVDYSTACIALHEVIAEIQRDYGPDRERPAPVPLAIESLRRQQRARPTRR